MSTQVNGNHAGGLHDLSLQPSGDSDCVRKQEDETQYALQNEGPLASNSQRFHKWNLVRIVLILFVVIAVLVIPTKMKTCCGENNDASNGNNPNIDASNDDDSNQQGIPLPTTPPNKNYTAEETATSCEAAVGPLAFDRHSLVRVAPNPTGVAYFFLVGKGSQLQAEFPCGKEEYYVKVSAFTGSCTDRHMVRVKHVLRCDESVTWFGDGDKKYVLKIETDQGGFNMVLFERSIANNVCRGALGPVRPNTAVNVATGLTSTYGGSAAAYFFLIGKGERMVAKFPCEKPTYIPGAKVTVFTGSCDSRQTVLGYNRFHCNGGDQTWFADLGKRYTIEIKTESPTTAGLLDILIVEGMLENDLCEGAVALPWPTETPSSVTGTGSTSLAAHVDKFFYDHRCDNALSYVLYKSAGGVWYTVVGRGFGITGSVLALNGSDASFDLFVYQGEDCVALECTLHEFGIFGESAFWRHEGIPAFWFAKAGVLYYIYVTSERQGPFSLVLDEFAVSKHDHCPGAETLILDSPVLVSTKNATVDAVPDRHRHEGYHSFDSPGLFYDIVGTGSVLKASSPCKSGKYHQSPRIYVFGGDCDRKRMLGENLVCDPESAAYWESVKGQIYHILVKARRNEANELLVSEAKPAQNDLCLGAIGPLEIGSVTNGDMRVARTLYWGRRLRRRLSPYRLPPSLYYTVLGTGDWVHAIVPCIGERRDFQISAFSGSCEHLVPFEANTTVSCQPDSTVTWKSEEGALYYLQVKGPGRGNRGAFSLSIGKPPDPSLAPENDLCLNASHLFWSVNGIGSIVVSGSAAHSSYEDLGYSRDFWNGRFRYGLRYRYAEDLNYIDVEGNICDWRQSRGVWYRVVGKGTGITATTCESTGEGDSSALLSVYEGEDCASLVCVVNYGSGCGEGSRRRKTITWLAEDGVTYYIYVDSALAFGGLFTLQLSQIETATNDECSGSMLIQLNSPTAVSTTNATAEFVGNWVDWAGVHMFEYLSNDRKGDVLPGVFYDVVGTGNVLKASAVCQEPKGSSPRVHVYEGDCDRMTPVGSKVICQPDSAVYWESTRGTVYHILFQSASPETKVLTVTEERPHLNDMCLGASGPLEPGSVTEGDTDTFRWTQLSRERRSLFSDMDRPGGLYYTVMGNGKILRVSSSCDKYDTSVRFSIFSGRCEARNYLSASDVADSTNCDDTGESNNRSIAWRTPNGKLYFIYAYPGSGDHFNFSLWTESENEYVWL